MNENYEGNRQEDTPLDTDDLNNISFSQQQERNQSQRLYPPVFSPMLAAQSQLLLEGEALLNDFKSAWTQQNFNIIESKWTERLESYILNCDIQVCSDLLVFLITKITNNDNGIYLKKFKIIIKQRNDDLNLESIQGKILKSVFQQIKDKHSDLVPQFEKMLSGKLRSQILPQEIGLPLLEVRALFAEHQFAKRTGLYLQIRRESAEIKAPDRADKMDIFKKTINKYLIPTSNQNNPEASNATSVEPSVGTSNKRLLDKGLEQSDDDSPSKKKPRHNGNVVNLTSLDDQSTSSAYAPVDPPIFSPVPTILSQPSIVSQPLEGEALLDDFKSAWIQQNTNIIRTKWTDGLKNYISHCDIQVCSDLLVFLITHIKNKDNTVYVDQFKIIIRERDEDFNLENILDEILNSFFKKIKDKHSHLIATFKKIMVRQRSMLTVPKKIALSLSLARDLFKPGKFAELTGLYLKFEKNNLRIRVPDSADKMEIFKTTIDKYLIGTSNQNNSEASSATSVESSAGTSERGLDEGLEQSDDDSPSKKKPRNDEDVLILPSPNDQLELYVDSGASIVEPALTDQKNTTQNLEEQDLVTDEKNTVENLEEQYPVTDQKNTTQNLEEQHPLTDEKNTTQNFEEQYPVLGKIWSSYTHFFSKKDLGNIGRTCKKFQIACTPRYDYSKVASTTEVFRFIDSGRIICQSLDSLMYAIAESSTKDIVVYGRKDKKIELITRLRQTTVDKESNPVIQYQQIVFSLDSKYMIACATALKDVDRIYTWNIKTQELISKTSFPKDESFSWSFPIYQCLDLKSIIICSNDAKIYKYDFIEGTKIKLLDLGTKETDSVEKNPFQQFASVVISNNQERILVANYRRNQITIYNLKEGSVIRNYPFNGKDKWSQNYHPFKFISKDKQFIHIEDGYLCIKGIDKTFDFKLAIGLELHTPDTLSRFSFSLSQNERFLVIPCLKAVVVIDLDVPNKDFLVIKCDYTVESAFFNSDSSSLMILANNVLTEYTFNALGLGNYFDSARLSYPGLGR